MVIKTLTRKRGVKQLIKYVFKDQDKLENEKFNPMVLKKNLNGTKERWGAQIELNNSLRKVRPKNMISCYHTVISFHPKDNEHITKKVLKDIGKKFIELRGTDSQHLITYHIEKTKHIHLHCVTGGTKLLTGIANRQSKFEFKQMKMELEKYQLERYPNLSHSIVQTKEKKERVTEIKNTRTSTKEKLNNELAQLYAHSKDTDSFYKSVQSKGYTLYERSGKVTGLIDKNLKYRFSKLGFDKGKLDYLNSPEHHTEIQMQELDDMRNSKNEEREVGVWDRERVLEQEEERQEEIETENFDTHNDDNEK